MPQNKSFSDRIKASARKMLEKEVTQFQTFDQEYKFSSHPIKRTFLAIGKLNSIHQGEIGIQEISNEAELTIQDVTFILQEFIDQRLIDGYIRDDINALVLRQDFYYCQIDQTQYTVFELHFQCSQCLRFICSSCFQKGSNLCPYCQGDLIPVPRIFKESDVQTLSPQKVRKSLGDYYQNQRSSVSELGVRKVSSKVIDDFKSLRKNWTFSSIKEKAQTYLDYRKHENIITKNEKLVLDTISALYEVEEEAEIPLQRIANLTRLQPLDLVHEIVSRLIAQQSINGFIESAGTFDDISDDKLILNSNLFHCEIHDEDLPISNAHYQCTNCFRSICIDCFSMMQNQGMEGCLFCEEQLTYFPGKR